MRTLIKIGSCALVLLAGISTARADLAYVQVLTASQFSTQFGTPTPTFNAISPGTGNFTSEGSGPFAVGSVTFDDQGNGELFVQGPNSGFDIGTGSPANSNALLADEGPNINTTNNTNINMTLASPAAVIGLIVGDAFAGTGGGSGTDYGIFNVTFGPGGGSPIIGIGNDNSLIITGGDSPTYFEIVDEGNAGISALNFTDTGLDPELDTITTGTPEPNSAWLLAIPALALGLWKRKTVAARLRSGAAPLALLALFAISAAPSFAQMPTTCTLTVPNNPLTAAGLATPYLLSGATVGATGCSQGDTTNGTMAFAQAAIYNPTAHTISLYTPLVADAPSSAPGQPRTPRYAISPAAVTLPAGAVVAIWFGYNFDNLTLIGPGVTAGNCFTGFGQFAACNTAAFWAAVNQDSVLLNNIKAMGGGTGADGLPCPVSRSFSIVDQDPNDNLPVNFLLTTETTPRTAQNTAANQAALAARMPPIGFSVQINPSDEAVVDIFIDGALGCTPPMVTDLTDPANPMHASLAVNELFAGLQSGQSFPLAFPNPVTSAQIFGGANGLVGPGYVSIGDTFTLVLPFTQPLSVATGCTIDMATGGCTYPYPAGNDLNAFNAYVPAMGYTGFTPTTPNPTINGTLNCSPGTAFDRTNTYRKAVNQPPPSCGSTATPDGSAGDASVITFCKQMFTRTGVGDHSPADLLFNVDFPYFNQAANGPGSGNLFQFLANRFAASYDLLGCAAVFQLENPTNVTNIGNTVAGTPPTNPPVLYYYPNCFPTSCMTSSSVKK